MKFISLIDTKNQNIITIDAKLMVLRLEIDGNVKEIRLKPFMISVLYEIFNKHPSPLSYDTIIMLLKEHNLIITDFTRLHRKLSEIRQFLLDFHPSLEGLLLNTRGVGYSLPLRFKNLHQIGNTKININFANVELNITMKILHELINDAIAMTAQNKVIKHEHGYVINRQLVKHIVVEKIAIFNECEKSILKEIQMHEADFYALRINYLLAKLKTYIGLVRISEYPISEIQWLDWFSQEVWMIFEELKKIIKLAESI